MAKTAVRSAHSDAHERAEDRLLRKMASLHKEKIVANTKAEERRAGHKGGMAEARKHHTARGKESHGMRALEKKAEAKHGGHKPGHVHHHHHHHHHHAGAHHAAK